MLELQRAEDLLERDEPITGIAYLARFVRQHPTNPIASRRLLSALTQRDFTLPVGRPLQHNHTVYYAEFSPDGQRIVTASRDGSARIWNARSGEPESAPLVHPADVRFAHFSPDGRRLLTIADDFQGRLWEVGTGRTFGRAMAHQRAISNAQFSPDGRLIATASIDGSARIWDAATGELLLPEMAHQGPVRCAAFSPDGALLATVSDDKTAQLWNVRTGQRALKPLQHSAGVTRAEFSPDGKWLVTAAWLSACVWDVKSGELISRPLVHPSIVYQVHFHPDGTRIATTTLGGLTRIWNAQDWAPLTPPTLHGGVNSVEFGPEGQRILTASNDNTVRLWDVDTGKELSPPMQHAGLVRSARFSPDGCFAVTASADKTARIWDLRLGGSRAQLLTPPAPVREAKFDPSGERIAAVSNTESAWIWNAWDRKPAVLPLAHAQVTGICFSSDGQRAATGSRDGSARIGTFGTGIPLTEPMRAGAVIVALSFSPDGQWLATSSSDYTVKLWNTKTGEQWGASIEHRGISFFVCFSKNSERLLSCDPTDDMAQIHDVKTGRLLLELRGHQGWIVSAEFSPDGTRIATGSEDGTARIWNAVTGQNRFRRCNTRHSSRAAHFSPMASGWSRLPWIPPPKCGTPTLDDRWARHFDITAKSMRQSLVLTARWLLPHRMTERSESGTRLRAGLLQNESTMARPFGRPSCSPDGRHILSSPDARNPQVWDVPPAMLRSEPAPVVRGAQGFSPVMKRAMTKERQKYWRSWRRT